MCLCVCVCVIKIEGETEAETDRQSKRGSLMHLVRLNQHTFHIKYMYE